MNSTAPAGDRRPPEGQPRSPSAPAPLCIPHSAICTPLLPPRIRIPFPAIDFDCGPIRYRTRPVELVAEAVQCRVQNEECRMPSERARGDEGDAAPPSSSSVPPSPSAILHSALCTPHSVPPSPSAILHSALCTPHSVYSLRKGLGVWHLVFEGREALLRPERGLLYAAWLLQHPPAQPLHALDLAARIPELYRAQLGLGHLTDPASGRTAPLEGHARLQERSLALDDAQALRALLRRERELEALLEDDSATEPEKAEALRELEELAEFQRRHGRRSRDAAQRVAATVRQTLRRLHAHLAAAVDSQGAPHPVLRPFAEHLRRYLLLPSSRTAGRGGRFSQSIHAGCFTYEPPPGVRWEASPDVEALKR